MFNPLKKFGMKRDRQDYRNYIYREIKFGEADELLREARQLNRKSRKLGDRKYFVWPVAGPLPHAMLVVGRITP